MRLMSRWCALLMLALLAGCAGNPLEPVPANSIAFELAGRMSVRYQARAFASALRWKQDAQTDEIWLNTPLGQTQAHLVGDRAGATLTTAEQTRYHAQSIEALTQSAFGWRFPLAGLRYWVLGRSAPGIATTATETDAGGRLLRFVQADWTVAFEYADAAAARPARLDIGSSDAQIRLVVDRLEVAQP
jgi:outer membrane lipoprotein LolB